MSTIIALYVALDFNFYFHYPRYSCLIHIFCFILSSGQNGFNGSYRNHPFFFFPHDIFGSTCYEQECQHQSEEPPLKSWNPYRSPHISLFSIIRMENLIDTTYITAISTIARPINNTGELAIVVTIGLSAGILGSKNKVAKKPATGIYMNTRPLMAPYL